MTTFAAERPDTEIGIILGVDTHLDFHVAVTVDHLGRRLGEASMPTTAKGYEELLSWAEGFGPVGCGGVEGTSSYGALCSPTTLGQWGSRCLRWSARSVGARAVASRRATPQTPKPLHGRFWPEKPRAEPTS